MSSNEYNRSTLSKFGSGENHNIPPLEEERHRLEELGVQIREALQKYPYESWYLSAPKAINKQLAALLSPDIKKKMEQNLPLDLTKISTNELLEHFKR